MLLIASAGTGKTISAISVAESYTQNRKIYVLLEDAVRQNFINEYRKYTGHLIDKSVYIIQTLGKFTNTIQKILKTTNGINDIYKMYSNSIIIVDEVHNIRENTSEDNVNSDLKIYDALKAVVTIADNSKLLLMSATPMYDSPREIISLMNLMLLNETNGLSLTNASKITIDANTVFDNKNKL